MSRDELRLMCVQPGCDINRYNIFLALNALLQRLRNFEVVCELWVDGSFVTEKQVPNDIDVSLMIEACVYDKLQLEAREYIFYLSQLYEKYEQFIDLHVCIVYPTGTEERRLDPPEDYAALWGIGHDERYLKGFIVLEMPDAVQ